jgi:uncharacterized CHY-type Zn-finger protein
MAAVVTCPKCGEKGRCPEKHLGRQGECSKCGMAFTMIEARTSQQERSEPFAADSVYANGDESRRVSFECGNCGKRLTGNASALTRAKKCPNCNQPIVPSANNQKPAPSPKSATSQIPVVKDFELKKGLLGKYTVWFPCPNCKKQLHSTEQELDSDDHCPECRHMFRVSSAAVSQIKSWRQEKLENQARRKEEKLRRQQEAILTQQKRQQERAHEKKEKQRQRKDLKEKRRLEKAVSHEVNPSVPVGPSGFESHSSSDPQLENQTDKQNGGRRKRWLMVMLLSVFAIGGYAVFRGTRASINPLQSFANSRLQAQFDRGINSDYRNAGVEVSVYYRDAFDKSVIVFDLQNVSSRNSRIDVFRILLEFSEQLKEDQLDTLELAFRGETKFTLDAAYVRTLGRERNFQNPAYTIRTFPENLKTPAGSNAYPEWSGGLLGVLSRQMDDFNKFHDDWYLDDLTYAQ